MKGKFMSYRKKKERKNEGRKKKGANERRSKVRNFVENKAQTDLCNTGIVI